MVLISPEATLTTVALVLAIPGLIQFTIGNVVAPKVMGDTLDLHPVTILLALIFWGMLWGIPGALLATPITVIMKLMLARMELTAPLSNWMAGRFSAVAAW
jgi:AI-2 transport protein TqsA